MAMRTRVPKTENERPTSKTAYQRSKGESTNTSDDYGTAALTPRQNAILQMQQTHGNTAVQRMLAQRQTTENTITSDVTDDPNNTVDLLSNSQVQKALLFYRTQPSRYTPEIINQIQTAVGTPSTGVMTASDVQAVAKYQANPTGINYPKLKIDGMAGPRTLPRLFSSGLADDKAIDEYVTESQDIIKDWERKSPEERRKAWEEEANKRLALLNIPPCVLIKDEKEGNKAHSDTWTIHFLPGLIDDLPASEEDKNKKKKNKVGGVLHEARHLEQAFRIAQMLAGKMPDPTPSKIIIAMKSDLKLEVADKAIKQPLVRGSMEALIAEGWYESEYGSQAAYRKRVLNELDNANAELARAENKKPKDQALIDRAEARQQKANAAYQDLPEENDAHRVGTAAGQRYKARY